jgi:hypothetical protein
MQNEPSIGAGASSIQPTLELPRYRGCNTELNPLSHMHRNSPEYWENEEKKCEMSPVLELVLQASNQLWNALVTEGPSLSSIHWATRIEIHQNVGKMKKRMQNEPSVGTAASSIQPTLEPRHDRGP